MKKIGLILLVAVFLLVTAQVSAVGVTSLIDGLELSAQAGFTETKTIQQEEVAIGNYSEIGSLVERSISVTASVYKVIFVLAALLIVYVFSGFARRSKRGDGVFYRCT